MNMHPLQCPGRPRISSKNGSLDILPDIVSGLCLDPEKLLQTRTLGTDVGNSSFSGHCLNRRETMTFRQQIDHSTMGPFSQTASREGFTNRLISATSSELDHSCPPSVRQIGSIGPKSRLRTRCRTLCPEGQKTPPIRQSPDIRRQKPVSRSQFATSNVG